MKSRNVSRRPSSMKQKRRSFLSWLSPQRAEQSSDRRLRFESLEDRRVLAANPFEGLGVKDPVIQLASWDLAQLSLAAEHGVPPTNVPESTASMLQFDAQGRVAVNVITSTTTAELSSQLAALGGQIAAQYGYTVTAWLPVSSIDDVLGIPSLNSMSPAYAADRTNVGAAENEGDVSLRSDDIKAFLGFDGTGIDVGVMSDSFDALGGAAADVAAGDLPAGGVTVLSDPFAASDEGRAMAQLVHDIAPGANIFFATASPSEAALAANITALVGAGMDIIVDDFTYLDAPFFQDGLAAQAAQSAVASGVGYYSSASNSGRRAYDSPFRPSGVAFGLGFGGELHDFDPGAGTDTFQAITIPVGGTIRLGFQWDQPFDSLNPAGPGSASDIDIYVLNSASSSVLASGVVGNIGSDPRELFSFTNPGPGTSFNIAITNFAGPNPGLMKYIQRGTSAFDIVDFDTASGTLFGHPNAPGATAVGAAQFTNTPPFGVSPAILEPFSSAGPTPILFLPDGTDIPDIVRLKPEFVGPDGTTTTVPGFGSFFGTSASAPNVAALHALILEATGGPGSITPAAVKAALIASAEDMLTPGFDFDTGAGFVNGLLGLSNAGGPFAVTFDGTAAGDSMLVRRDLSGNTEFLIGGMLQFEFPTIDITTIDVNGMGGSDTLTVDFVNGNPLGSGALSYDGGAGVSDRMVLVNGSATTEVSTATGPNSGIVTFTGGAIGAATINYAGLEPVDDTVAVVNYSFDATAAGEIINIVNGPVTNGFVATQINSGSGTFELQNIANKTNVTVNGLAGDDTFNVNNPTPAAGLASLTVNTGSAVTRDTVNVLVTPASVVTNVTSDSGLDNVNIGNAGSINGILGVININNPPSASDIVVDDSADAVGRTITATSGVIIFNGQANINYVDNDVGNITIQAGSGGDTFNIASTNNLFGSDINTFNGNGGNDIFNYTGIGSGAFSTNNLNGGTGDDTFNVSIPITSTSVVNVDGGPNDTASPGDSLIVNCGGLDVTVNGNNQLTFPGSGNLNYVNIETLVLTNLNSLTVNGDAGDNQLVLTRILVDRFRSILDGGPAILFDRPLSPTTQFTFNGAAGDDTFTVDNASFSDLVNLRTAYNGDGNDPVGTEASGPPGDTLVITGQETDGGIVARETYLVGDTQDAGTWILDRDGSRGPGASLAGNGDELVVVFTGLEPVDTDTPAAVFDVVYDTGDADSIRVENGGLLNGSQSIRVVDLSGTFETFRFANKTLVRLHLNDQADTAELNYTIPAAGLTTLEIYGHAEAAVVGPPADDNAIDDFIVLATAAGVASNNLFGQGGNDQFRNVAVSFSMAGLQSPISVDGGAGTDNLAFAAAADAGPVTATLTNTQLTSTGWATITYAGLENFFFESTGGNDTIDILTTAAPTGYRILGDGGSDAFTIGNTTANFNANTFTGNLTGILGPVSIYADLDGSLGANDTLNVDASGQGALAGAAAITRTGSVTYPIIIPFTLAAPMTQLTNFAPALIEYAHDSTTSPVAVANRLENLNVRTSTGNDSVTVNHTTAITQTTLDTRQGNDVVTINGDNLSAANLFRGLGAPSVADGNDFFTLNITANLGAGAFAPLTSVQIEGNAQLAGIDGRDRLLINDNSGAARNLNYHYLAAGSGDIDIEAVAGAGLAGAVVPTLALQVRTMESVSFDAAGANNDTVQVTGIVAVDDILTIVPFSEASGQTLVYRGGLPYLGAPPATIVGARPGVSGGSAGPDLAIDGVAPAGITVDGGGNSGAAVSGDRVVVHGFSENQINNGGAAPIFSGSFAALGAGVIQPAVAVGTAYDDILVTDALVDITNVGVGQLLLVNVNTATFTQNDPLPPTDERAGLLVNGGDEVGTRPNGVADDFFVTVSNNFNIKVNGNLPDPATFGPDGLPRGDQLNFSGPGSLNIFSDKATPPNVQIQFSGSTFGVQYSSIERFAADLSSPPNNGTANLIGDNNNPSAASNQPDNYVVRGRDVDGDFTDAGYQEMTVSINGSAPILLNGVRYLKVYGDDLQGTFDPANLNTNDASVDTLDIRAFADNVPTGWGVDVFFNEGAPAQADGLQQDLIIYHTATGVAAPPDAFGAGTVSEDIVVQPTGADNGEIRSTNAADGSLIYVLSYVNNTDIVFVDDDGVPGNGVPPGPPPPAGTTYDALSDVDSLTLRGTNPNNGYTSGSERFDINITGVLGTPATPVISVRDNATGAILYRVREFRTQTQVAGVTDASDFLALNDSSPGSLVYTTITLAPMGGNDIVQVDDPATPAPLATDVLDGESILLFTSIDVGAGNDRVNLSRTTVALPGAATLTTQIHGGDGDDLLIGSPYIDRIYGNDGNDTMMGRAGNDLLFGGEGNDIFGNPSLVANAIADDAGNDQFHGQGGSDVFFWEPGDGDDLVEGGAGDSDQHFFFGNAGAEQFFLFADVNNNSRIHLFRVQAGIDIDAADIEEFNINPLTGADTVTIGRSELGILSDLTTTTLQVVDVSLATDGAADSIFFEGRPADDNLLVSTSAGIVKVAGLSYDLRFDGSDAGVDLLTVSGNEGNDTIKADPGVEALVLITLNGNAGDDFLSADAIINGGAGDDFLVGGAGADTINGDDGDDTIRGGDGIDTMSGGAGNDTFLHDFDGDADIYDGGAGYDTVLIVGTPGNDTITANQFNPAQLDSSLNGALESDVLQLAAAVGTIERVRIEAGSGDDLIAVTAADVIGTNLVVDSVLFDVDGGPANTRDRLSVQDNLTGDLVLYRQGTTSDSGSISVGPGNAEALETVFTNIERVDPIAGAGGAIRFFKLDTLEWNDDIANATHLGADETINVDPNIDPGAVVIPGFAPLPADNDFFRIVAERTGTLDIQVYFTQLLTVPSGRPGLPNAGNLDIELYDVDGTLIVDGILGGLDFGINDATDNERIRIPAVAGQTYYLRVLPNGTAINTYSITTINTAAPVPFDIELLDTPLNLATNPTTGAPGATAVGVSSDTGRSRFDNITFDNDPTILIRVPDVILVAGAAFLDDVPANGAAPGSPFDEQILIPFRPADLAINAGGAGFRVAVFVTEIGTDNTGTRLAGYAQLEAVARPGVFTFTFAPDALAPDGSYFISSRVEMIDPTAPEQNQGFGALAESLEIIVDTILPPASFGSPGIANDGLILSDECPTPLINLTNIARPTFWGRAEADTVINLYLDSNANGLFEPATDVFLGQTVATPFDGGDQYPNGYWEIESRLSLNDPSLVPPLPFDGPRTLFVTAEDVAGNITGSPTAVVATTLQIVIDTQGPQVIDVDINNAGNPYDLFDPKPSTDGPTPLVNSIVISFQDLPPRVAGSLYVALEAGTVVPGNFRLVGDYNGIIPISSIILVNNPPLAGSPATATVELVFASPLPDDRFTLTIDDSVTDPLCNALNGESNASEPQENPSFPSGDATSGGDFVARFTVDTRPEVGTWGAGSAWIDTNGNTTFDQDNGDFTNRDITYYMGYTSDNLFAGNFVKAVGGVADGFDKLAAYGRVGTQWRVLVDVNNDGAITPGVDVSQVQPGASGINGLPVAGNFDGNLLNGDEFGVFTGTTWYFDTNHDWILDVASAVPWSQNGYPVVGNYDGVAGDDLATYKDNTFSISFGLNSSIDRTFRFGFPTPNNRPVSADMDEDGHDDLGLFVPNRAGVSPDEDAEWYILVSGGTRLVDRIHADPIDGVPVIDYTPVPFGDDLYIQYGDQFGLPILGNFDPPVTPGGSTSADFPSSNPNNPLDVNNDGSVSPIDALLVINEINANGSHALETTGFHTAPFIDTDRDNVVSPHDVLLVINHLNAQQSGGSGEEGEGNSFAPASAHDEIFGEIGAIAPVTSANDGGIISLLADEQVRAKRNRQAE